MTEILLTVIIILLIINIVIALTKNNRLQTERLEGLLREEMKENRDELGRNIRVRSNLLWGNKNASDADLWAALETAQAAEFVKATKNILNHSKTNRSL